MFMRIEFPQFMKVIKLLSNFKLIVGPIVIMIFLELAFPYFLHKTPLYYTLPLILVYWVWLKPQNGL